LWQSGCFVRVGNGVCPVSTSSEYVANLLARAQSVCSLTECSSEFEVTEIESH